MKKLLLLIIILILLVGGCKNPANQGEGTLTNLVFKGFPGKIEIIEVKGKLMDATWQEVETVPISLSLSLQDYCEEGEEGKIPLRIFAPKPVNYVEAKLKVENPNCFRTCKGGDFFPGYTAIVSWDRDGSFELLVKSTVIENDDWKIESVKKSPQYQIIFWQPAQQKKFIKWGEIKS
jgi:hypothetical protein